MSSGVIGGGSLPGADAVAGNTAQTFLYFLLWRDVVAMAIGTGACLALVAWAFVKYHEDLSKLFFGSDEENRPDGGAGGAAETAAPDSSHKW